VTLILALRFREGLLLASDSQGTLAEPGNPPIRLNTEKLFVLHGLAGWAASGAVGLTQRARYQLDRDTEIAGALRNEDREQCARKFFDPVNALQKEARNETVDGRPDEFATLIVGYARREPFILEIDRSGSRQFLELPYGAIGSGYVFAMHAMLSVAHYNIERLSRPEAQALAYRIVDNAIQVAAHGLAGPVQILTVTEERAWVLSGEDVSEIRRRVDLWKQKDIEALKSLFDGA
jgi:20S proteasome alpha/beta subunit